MNNRDNVNFQTPEWQGCYKEAWKGFIVDEAFSHPAKFSHALIGRIYDHALKMGWVKAGDTVIDPFGGVALGALHSLISGLNWIGVELELKFVSLGQQNIDLWNKKFRHWPHLGTARIIQGDSRNLGVVLSKLGPQTGPFNPELILRGDSTPNFIVSSPPFHQIIGLDGGASKRPEDYGHIGSFGKDYGHTPGNLANMKEGEISALISSPPWETSNDALRTCTEYGYKARQATSNRGRYEKKYGENQLSGDTFWQASKEIIQGCYDLLKPGGHAIWVCKDYVKAGKRIPFSDRWQVLCESVGFKLVCRHQAMLVENHGSKTDFEGVEKEIITERKSFFRRLAEKKGSPRIDWEMVQCLVKVGG